MNVSIHSPLASEVFSSFDSLSPPPPPVGKRAQFFFPSNAPAPPTPTFFPAPCRDPPSDAPAASEGSVETDQLPLLASRPVPRFSLMPRPRTDGSRASVVLTQIQADRIPPPPFQFPDESHEPVASVTGRVPSPPGPSKVSDSANGISESGPKKPASVASRSQPAKLPAYQRRGMHRRTVEKRNSFAAKSA